MKLSKVSLVCVCLLIAAPAWAAPILINESLTAPAGIAGATPGTLYLCNGILPLGPGYCGFAAPPAGFTAMLSDAVVFVPAAAAMFSNVDTDFLGADPADGGFPPALFPVANPWSMSESFFGATAYTPVAPLIGPASPGFTAAGTTYSICSDSQSIFGGAAAPQQEPTCSCVACTTSDVPEPATLSMLMIGIAGLIAYGWRQRKQRA